MLDPMPFRYTPKRLCALLGVSIATARRYRAGKFPVRVVRILRALEGELGEIDSTWSGWIIRRGLLISPEGWEFGMGEIRSIPFLHAQVRTYSGKLRLAKQADWIEGKYVEPAETLAPLAESAALGSRR